MTRRTEMNLTLNAVSGRLYQNIWNIFEWKHFEMYFLHFLGVLSTWATYVFDEMNLLFVNCGANGEVWRVRFILQFKANKWIWQVIKRHSHVVILKLIGCN